MLEVIATVERQVDEPFLDHHQHHTDVAEMERRLGKHRLTGQQRCCDLLRHLHRPLVVPIVAVCEPHEKAGVGDGLQEREKPFRDERSRGPRTDPASRMKGRPRPPVLAFSSCSRTMRPWDSPVRSAVAASQAANCLVRRTVIV